MNTVVVDRIYGMGNTSLPASLSSTTNNTSIDDLRPVVQFRIDNGTGVRDMLAERISVYPNPAEHFIQIMNESASPLESIVITNAIGKVVCAERQGGIQADHRINVENMEAGPYILVIQTIAGRIVMRVTVP